MQTPSPKSYVNASTSPKYSSSDSTPPQLGSPLTVLQEANDRLSGTKAVSIKRRNSRRKLSGIDVSPDYATFRDRTKEDALTRKLSLPRNAVAEMSGKQLIKEVSDKKLLCGPTAALADVPVANIQTPKRRRATSETVSHLQSLQDISLPSFKTTQQLANTREEHLTGKTVGISRVHSSPAFLSEVVKRLPLPIKSEPDTASQSFSDFLRQIATESLAVAPLSKLSSPIFRVSDQADSPHSDFIGGSTPPNLFQISPHSWSELAELAVARERKLSLTKRSVSRTPSDTSEQSERKKSGEAPGRNEKIVPHVTTCKGAKATVGFEESSTLQKPYRQKSELAPTSGIDTHIGTVFLQPPDLPEETLMPIEHLKVMDLIESKIYYVENVIHISEETAHLWSETHELFLKYSRDSKHRELEALMPTEKIRVLQEIALLSEAIKILLRIIEFAQKELDIGNLRPTKAMKTGMFILFIWIMLIVVLEHLCFCIIYVLILPRNKCNQRKYM